MSVVVLLCPAVIFDLWGCDWYGGKVPEPSPPPTLCVGKNYKAYFGALLHCSRIILKSLDFQYPSEVSPKYCIIRYPLNNKNLTPNWV